jgi:uncharacterized protein
MGVKKIKPIIDIYINEVKNVIKPEKVILFGSYAKGMADEESDIDLLIISKDFNGKTSDKRHSLLSKAYLNQEKREKSIDYFGITPEEYNNASTLTTLGEAKETGVTVYSA